jgi:protein SFI1
MPTSQISTCDDLNNSAMDGKMGPSLPIEACFESGRVSVAIAFLFRTSVVTVDLTRSRARHLRLPTATPRPAPAPLQPPTAPCNPAVFPRRTLRAEHAPWHTEAGPSRPLPHFRPSFDARMDVDGSRRGRPRSDSGVSEPRPPRPGRSVREASPARSRASFAGLARPSSVVGSEGGRGRLWLELRRERERSRPPSEDARTRKPP